MGTQRIIDQNSFDPIEEETPAQTEQRETIEDILTAFNASDDDVIWTIRVGMVTGPARTGFDEPFLFNCSPTELPLDERLRDNYGTGTYRCRVYRNKRIYRSFTVTIGPTPKIKENTQTDTTSFIQAIEASNIRMMSMFKEMLDRQNAPQVQQIDPFAMMERMTAVMLNMQNLSPKPTVVENQVNPMEMFTKGIELAQSMSASGETGIMDIVKEFVKSPIMETMMGGMNQNQPKQIAPSYYTPIQPTPQVQPGLRPNQPSQNNGVPPVMPPNASQMSMEQINKLISDQIAFLISKAQNGSDPALYAEFVLDNMPEPTVQYMLNNPNILSELAGINPAINMHLIWFQKLLAEMKQMLQAPGDGTSDYGDEDGSGNGRSTPEPNGNNP